MDVRGAGDGRGLYLAVDDHRLLLDLLSDVLAKFTKGNVTLRALEFLQQVIGEESVTLLLIGVSSLVIGSCTEGDEVATGRTLLTCLQRDTASGCHEGTAITGCSAEAGIEENDNRLGSQRRELVIELLQGVACLCLGAVGIDRQQESITSRFVRDTVTGIVEDDIDIVICFGDIGDVLHGTDHLTIGSIRIGENVLGGESKGLLTVFGENLSVVTCHGNGRNEGVFLVGNDDSEGVGIVAPYTRDIDIYIRESYDDLGTPYLRLALAALRVREHTIVDGSEIGSHISLVIGKHLLVVVLVKLSFGGGESESGRRVSCQQ